MLKLEPRSQCALRQVLGGFSLRTLLHGHLLLERQFCAYLGRRWRHDHFVFLWNGVGRGMAGSGPSGSTAGMKNVNYVSSTKGVTELQPVDTWTRS